MFPEQEIVDRLMDAAADLSSWPDALTGLARACNAEVGSMILVDRGAGRGRGFCLGVAERWAEPFIASQSRHVAIGARLVEPGAVFTDRSVIKRRDFERSHFFESWARPSGQTDYAGVAVINDPDCLRLRRPVEGAAARRVRRRRAQRASTPRSDHSRRGPGLGRARLG